jgi:putative cell wall-binding protein
MRTRLLAALLACVLLPALTAPAAAQTGTPPLVLRTFAGTGPVEGNVDGESVLSVVLSGPPVVTGGVLYQAAFALGGGREVRTVDLSTLRVDTLEVRAPHPLWQPVAGADGRLYAASDAQIWSVDLATGAVRLEAGNGERTAPGAGDRGPATEAQVVFPRAVVPVGDDLYFADDAGVRRVDRSSRTVATVVPADARSMSSLAVGDDVLYIGFVSEVVEVDLQSGARRRVADADQPSGLVLDGRTLYIADAASVRAVDLDRGRVTTVAGTDDEDAPLPTFEPQPAGDVRLAPLGLSLSDGVLYTGSEVVVAIDLADGTARAVTAGHEPTSAGDGGPAAAARLAFPSAVAVGASQVFIAEESAVRVVDRATGTISTLTDGLPFPTDLALAGDVLYVAASDERIRAVDVATGQARVVAGRGPGECDPTDPQTNGDGGPATQACLGVVASLAAVGDALYVGGRVVRRVDLATGTIETVEQLPPAENSRDLFPAGGVYQLAATGDTLYAADAFAGRIDAVDLETGDVERVGDGFERIAGLDLDRERLLVVDADRVRAVDVASGAVATLAGGGAPRFTPDGAPAAGAGVLGLADVVALPDGGFLVVESANHRVRLVEPAAGVPERLRGEERAATAAAVSAAAYPSGVPVAFVVGGGGFEDALVAGPAAARLGGPLLLTSRDDLPAATRAELERLDPDRIVVVGGRPAVSDAVVAELDRLAPTQRVAGEDIYATGAAVAAAFFPQAVDTVWLATGADYPDGLAGGAPAARDGEPVLLTAPDRLPDSVAAELRRLAPDRVVVLGGLAAVDERVAGAVREATGATVVRLRGLDRTATAGAVAAAEYTAAATVFVATGENFPDALAAVPAAARAGAPVLLVRAEDVPTETAQQLRRLRPGRIVVLGGPAAVSEPTRLALAGYLRVPEAG